MQHSRHPAPAACRAPGAGAGGRVAVPGPASGAEGLAAGAAPPNAVSLNTVPPNSVPPLNTAQPNPALCWSFPGSALDVSLSRRWLAAAVEQAWGAGDDTDRVVLAYSEVATNAVVHGAGPVTVRTRIRECAVTCEVADCSAHVPRIRHADAEDLTGRGLDLVEMTVDRFAVEIGEAGKTVSFEVGRQLGAPGGSGRSPLPQSGAGPAGAGSESAAAFAPASESALELRQEEGRESEIESQNRNTVSAYAAPQTSRPGPGTESGTGPARWNSVGESGGGSTDGGLVA